MTWIRFYQAFIFAITFLLGALIPLFPFLRGEKKRLFYLVLLSVATLVQVFLVEWLSLVFLEYVPGYASYSYLRYVLEFFLEILLIPPLCRLGIISSLFVVNIAYCFQHVCQYLYQILLLPTGLEMLSWQGILIRVFFTLAYSAAFAYLTRKRFTHIQADKIRESLTLIVSSMVVILTTIVLNSIVWLDTSQDQILLQLYILLSSCIVGILIIALNMNILDKDILFDELSVVRKMFRAQRAHYRNEKQVIDALNIKSHDLKHQIRTLQGRIAAPEYEELTKLVDSYDAIFNTGNKAVDVLLTEKDILCRNKGIRFTTLLDGAKLSFIQESDLYSLLGNILDNAIEATEKLTDPQRRVISLTSEEKLGFLSLHEENYFDGAIDLEGGMPKTRKKEKGFHGFGIKSIGLVVKKYNGTFQIDIQKDTFILDILFPINEKGDPQVS